MEFIICVDLEGIHGVVGEPYQTLTASCDYKHACEGAVLEINTVARALFDLGAKRVYVWDNHGGGGNIDTSLLDERITVANVSGYKFRGDFAGATAAVGVIFLGYHAKEGTPSGVLAHTFNSKGIQYVKLNGISIGELFVDTRIFASHGIKPMLHVGDDISIREMNEVCPFALNVVTKYGKGRNSAILRARDEVLCDIDRAVREAVGALDDEWSLSFPTPASLEVRYTRAERSYEIVERAGKMNIPAQFGEDTHILRFTVTRAQQIPNLL